MQPDKAGAYLKGDSMNRQMMLFPALAVTLCALAPSGAFAFGAIAVAGGAEKGQPVFGIVTGHATPAKASKAAFDKCKANGGVNCKVAAVFEKCGSIAASDTTSGIGWGNTGRIARNLSLRNCGDDCRVIGNECEE